MGRSLTTPLTVTDVEILILQPFITQLDDEVQFEYFQQNGATAHRAGAKLINFQFYDYCVICLEILPPRPDQYEKE
jgi:hypothetical protein